MVEKLYYSMGEVTEMFDVEPSLIRYWCTQFSCLSPKRNAKGNRVFSPQDIERLKRIHHLLREKKMTIEGAKKAMRKRVIEAEQNDSDIALLEQLQTLRAMLVDMRDSIGEEQPVEEQPVEAVATPVATDEAQSEPTQKKKRAPRRKLIGEEGVVERPLFPFYEQTLF
ncbi:MAG: MerR family transcriptional regulator [Alistipes sp.]|jgi:DNA-binding transcriptional MerR regulator|nr:MerR family transcriptional regulator [Alistipes sp.]